MTFRASVIRAVVILFFAFSAFIVSAQESFWTVAAVRFALDTDTALLDPEMQKTAQALTEDIPMLILSQLSNSLERSLAAEEVYKRELYDLQSKMQTLVNDYSSVLKARDQQLFISQSKKDLQSKIEEQEIKLSSAAKKIDDNFASQEELSRAYSNQSTSGTAASNKREKVVLYKSSPNELYAYDATKTKTDEELEVQINRDKIRGLITGSIKVFGEYLQISCSLSVYPKKTDFEPHQIMVHFTETEFAASEISSYLMSLISNSLPSVVNFKLYPEEETKNASVFISDVYLKGSVSSTELLRGIYSVRIECPGYETVSFAYSINQNTEYDFSIKMKKQLFYPVRVNNSYSTPGTMYLNAASSGSFPADITVNGQIYLGEFVSDEGWSNYFVYNSSFAHEQKSFDLLYANKDIAQLIEKSRDRLYISYAAVVFALPVYFYTNAVYKNMLSAQNQNIPIGGSISDWKTASTISLSSVVVLGVNMGVQLALYLADANKILPKQQKPPETKGK